MAKAQYTRAQHREGSAQGRVMIGSARQNTLCIPSNVKLSTLAVARQDDSSNTKCILASTPSMIGGHRGQHTNSTKSHKIHPVVQIGTVIQGNYTKPNQLQYL